VVALLNPDAFAEHVGLSACCLLQSAIRNSICSVVSWSVAVDVYVCWMEPAMPIT